jgi:hypothetical protein
MQILRKGKGNRPICKSDAKLVEDGKIVNQLPTVPINGERVSLFQVRSPDGCPGGEEKLELNKHYDRYILSSEGVLKIPVCY